MKFPSLLPLCLSFWIGVSAHAQQLHFIDPGTVEQQPVSPQVIERRIASTAIQYQAYSPVPRIALFDIAYPANAEEYRSLAGYGVIVVSAVTQASDELPPSRVYVRVAAKDVELKLLSSVRSDIAPNDILSKVFGVHRWDGLYLFPVHLRMQGLALMMDFAKNRSGFVLSKFDVPARESLAMLPVAPPLSDSPSEAALMALVVREYPGFIVADDAQHIIRGGLARKAAQGPSIQTFCSTNPVASFH